MPRTCPHEISAPLVNPGATRATALLLGCMLCSSLAGQEVDGGEAANAPEQNALEWAVALGNRFRELHDPVVAAYSLGVLAGIVCPVGAAATAVMLPRDQDSGLFALRQVVQAANDAYMTPHEGRFDPTVIRKVFSSDTHTSIATDGPLVVLNSRCTCVVVDTGRGRHNFNLKVPGVITLTLSALVRNASGVDPGRLESVLIGLQEERPARALHDLAALRLAEQVFLRFSEPNKPSHRAYVARCENENNKWHDSPDALHLEVLPSQTKREFSNTREEELPYGTDVGEQWTRWMLLPRILALALMDGFAASQLTLPDGPAGRTLEAWIEAFNSFFRSSANDSDDATHIRRSLRIQRLAGVFLFVLGGCVRFGGGIVES